MEHRFCLDEILGKVSEMIMMVIIMVLLMF